MTNTKKPRDLGPLERAVYDLIRAGTLNAAHLPLYRRPIQALTTAGLITMAPDGRYLDAAGPGSPPIEPPPPPPPPMVTLVSRVPKELLAALDELGPTRSEATRRALEAGIAVLRAPPPDAPPNGAGQAKRSRASK